MREYEQGTPLWAGAQKALVNPPSRLRLSSATMAAEGGWCRDSGAPWTSRAITQSPALKVTVAVKDADGW